MTKNTATKKPRRPSQGDSLRLFGPRTSVLGKQEVCSYAVGESSQVPGSIHITQYASRLVGTLTPAQARALAANLIEAAETLETEARAAEVAALETEDAS